MFGHPGKKLLFMGQEFGQFQEWSEARELDWFLLAEPEHEQLQAYVKELLALYKKYPALYANDDNEQGFEWINADDAARSIFSFIRKSPTGRNNLLFVINYTPVSYTHLDVYKRQTIWNTPRTAISVWTAWCILTAHLTPDFGSLRMYTGRPEWSLLTKRKKRQCCTITWIM